MSGRREKSDSSTESEMRFSPKGKTILEWIGYTRLFTENKHPAL